MVSTYTNVIFDTFTKNVEKLLRAEFGSSAIIYIADEATKQQKQSIRIWPLSFAAVDPPFLAIAQEYRYTAELVVIRAEGPSTRKTTDARLETLSRSVRILNDNKNYSPSSVYKWHDGLADEIEKNEEGWRFLYSATVVEPIA